MNLPLRSTGSSSPSGSRVNTIRPRKRGGGYYNIPIQAYVAKELEMRENGKAIAQKADELYLQVLEDE